MSTSDVATASKPAFTLTVTAPAATELIVIDSALAAVERGLGQLSIVLAPGLYKVRATAGTRTEDRYLQLQQDESISFGAEDLVYRSIVPLKTTRSVDAQHALAAKEHSKLTHVQLGNGSQIFVMARGHDLPGVDPSVGLSLSSASGQRLVDFSQVGHRYLDSASPCASCNVVVSPGAYVLRVEVPGQGVLEQTLVASPGFQTQVFLPQRRYVAGSDVRRMDLVNAAILLARLGQGFEPESFDARVDDLARISLANLRPLMRSQDMRALLQNEQANPMLGIYGGHLLLLRPEPDLELLRDIVSFLRGVLSTPHPDVEALALRLEPNQQLPPELFATPPMLQSSWNLILQQAMRDKELVPEGSLSARIAERRWGRGPWLVWKDADAAETPAGEGLADATSPTPEVASVRAQVLVETQVSPASQNRALAPEQYPALLDAAGDPRELSPDPQLKLSASEAALYRYLQTYLEAEPLTLGGLARDLQLPPATVRSMLKRLDRKLSEVAGERQATPQFHSCFEWVPDELLAGDFKERPALAKDYQWRQADTITVAFLDGDPALRQRVEQVARLWERYANLTLRFVAEPAQAQVRITFGLPGASSVLGTACRAIPAGKPTMVLGALSPSSPAAEIYRLVLHEFGHALGLVHEHQNPAGGIQWNKAAAYQYYGRSGWSRDKIDKNVFEAYSKDVSRFAYTAIDRSSIMMYPIPPELTLNGFEARWNATLSQSDVDFIRQMYPGRLAAAPPVVPESFGDPGPATGAVTIPTAQERTPAPQREQQRPIRNLSRSSPQKGTPMSTTERRLERLRRFNEGLRGTDAGLFQELRDTPPAALEGVPTRDTPEAGLELESIVLRRARPVLAIKQDQVELVFRDNEDVATWRARLQAASDVLGPTLPAVGRVDLVGGPMDWVGTGWLVAPQIMVTNRHVAAVFTARGSAGLGFTMGERGRVAASIDFLHEVDNPKQLGFRLTKVLHVEPEPGPDLAFFEVELLSGDARLALPVPLARRAPRVTANAAVIGYPAADSRIPDQDLMSRIFGDVYNSKRLAPGSVTRVDAQNIEHDASTLGGNSGSLVFDLDAGEAVGLHFSGRFLSSNFAVRADVVAERLADLRSGRSATRSPVVAAPVERRGSAERGEDGDSVSLSIPLVVTLSVGKARATASVSVESGAPPTRRVEPALPPSFAAVPDEPVAEAEARVEDYGNRKGYDAKFLGKSAEVPLPEVTRNADDVLTFGPGGKQTVLDYQHFSVVMSKSRRLCLFSACNIDGELSRKTKRAAWHKDPRIPSEQQVIGECYGSPPKFSRGHMTRREDPAWGSEKKHADLGSDDSMHVTNAVPQMQAFNSPIWLGLEDYALQNARRDSMKISVITGPYYKKNDPKYDGVKVPRSFWKIIAFIHDESGELCATGYEMDQDDQLPPEEEFVFDQFFSKQLSKTTQVSITSIEKKSGLSFGDLADFDPGIGEEEAVSAGAGVLLASFNQIRFTR